MRQIIEHFVPSWRHSDYTQPGHIDPQGRLGHAARTGSAHDISFDIVRWNISHLDEVVTEKFMSYCNVIRQ